MISHLKKTFPVHVDLVHVIVVVGVVFVFGIVDLVSSDLYSTEALLKLTAADDDHDLSPGSNIVTL